LVPELLCSDVAGSIAFYRDILGFEIAYERPEEGFAFMNLGGAQIMLERESDYWFTGKLERPYGRGINFEIGVEDVDALCLRVKAAGVTLFREIEERWYRKDDNEVGNRQFLVQDPDGYLLRFAQDLGARLLQQQQ
jgi:catechol 2,3-dioxygenase-like lactoylglutathione lyase family enzyme